MAISGTDNQRGGSPIEIEIDADNDGDDVFIAIRVVDPENPHAMLGVAEFLIENQEDVDEFLRLAQQAHKDYADLLKRK